MALFFDLSTLLGKLNETTTVSLTAAIANARARGHKFVQLEHWLLALLDVAEADFVQIIRHFDVDEGQLSADLVRFIDRLPEDDAHFPSIHPQIKDAVCQAWLVASLNGESFHRIRSGHLLIACLGDEAIADKLGRVLPQIRRINFDELKSGLQDIALGSVEAKPPEAPAGIGQGTPSRPATAGARSSPALDRFTVDLTALAASGKIDAVLGRDEEIRQVIDILVRRRQNNPILTGEAGVGKTAVVEGFALRVARGEVPSALSGIVVRTLDLGLLQAGASMKGEFENRLVQVIEEVRASLAPVILFIDEAHTLIGAGGQAGQNDAANLLKPALARGDLRTIAATTWAEYKKYFERDAALTRRFQVVKVEEPEEAVAVDMLRGLAPVLQEHHKVRILDEALVETVRLSRRYIPARQLPDKAVSVLDTACARVAMTLSATPAVIEDTRRRVERIDVLINSLRRELAVGQSHETAISALENDRAVTADRLAGLEVRWDQEKSLAETLHRTRDQLESDGGDTESARAEYIRLRQELSELQGDDPLVLPTVDKHAVAAVIAAWTGIPVGRMGGDEIRTVLALRDRLKSRIIGQDQALEAIAEAVVMSRAKLMDPRKPTGVFLMVGTSGVGKTETAMALAELLYGGEQNLTVINMSEFKEEHKISMLLGSPPGYIGYGEGGVLTEAVRRRPYGIVLLDEMEKAHPGLQDLFYQVFDKGSLRDGEGRDIDFKNTIIIMTSNAGTDLIASLCADPETAPDAAGLADALRPELLKTFKPAFLGRVTMVPYFPLSDDIIRQIVTLQLERIVRRVRENYQAEFSYAPDLVERIASRCHEGESGARAIERILAQGLLPELSTKLLLRVAAGEAIRTIHVGTANTGGFSFEIF